MADNVTIDVGNNPTVTFAAENISSVFYERIKLIDATAGSTTGTGIAANPFIVKAQGMAASGSAVSGNPLLVAGGASSSEPTATSSGNALTALMDLMGRLVNVPYALPQQSIAAYGTSTTNTAFTVLNAAGSGIRNYITQVVLSNSSATGIDILLLDGVSNLEYMWLPPSSMIVMSFPVPLRCSANTAFNCKSGGNISTIYCAASGYFSKN